MNILLYAGANALLILIIFSITYLIAIRKNKWSIIDTAWGLGFVVSSWLGFGFFPFSIFKLIPVILISLWGFRLAYYLSTRNRHLTEDPRYISIKKEYEEKSPFLVYKNVFLLQGALMWVMCMPLYFFLSANITEFALIPLLIGLPVCIIGLYWEWTADAQLKYFIEHEKKDHPNKAITTGLWGYSRHPNYFGEISFWVGIWLISLAPHKDQHFLTWISLAVIGIVSPLTIAIIISKVTGPMLEEHMKKYENYADIMKLPYIVPRLFRKKLKTLAHSK